MNTKPLLIAAAVVIVLAVGYFAFVGGKASAPTETATTTDTGVPVTAGTVPVVTSTTTTTVTTTTAPKKVTITYGPNGFSPANVTVAVGTKITWVNQGGGSMWIASAVHPTHTTYDGTSVSEHCINNAPKNAGVFDECKAGSSFSFTFTKAGSWPYHNHAQSSDHGTITVQ